MGCEEPLPSREDFPALGPDGIEALAALLERWIPREQDERQVRACQELLEKTAQELAYLLGPRGVEAVLVRALSVVRTRLPGVDHFVLISREKLELSPRSAEEGCALSRQFCFFYLTAMDITSSLIGFDLVEPVLRRVELRREEQGAVP